MDMEMGDSALASLWEIGKDVWWHLAALHDPRFRRWHQLIRAHHLDTITAFASFGEEDAPVSVAFDRHALAEKLSPRMLERSAETLNVRTNWLFGHDRRPYDFLTLDRSFDSLVRDLLTWQSAGTGHALLVFKTLTTDLVDEPSQDGALVLVRVRQGIGEDPIYVYRPIYSLHSWGNPKQNRLAMRAIWAAWHLQFTVRGYEAHESQCAKLREGKLFPGSLRRVWDVGTWRPYDYVVRPSRQARGDNAMVAAIEHEHSAELRELANQAGRSLRCWGDVR